MPESTQEPTRFVHGGIELDRLKRKVAVNGLPLELTMREFALLELFLAHRGEVLTRDRIAAAIWETPTKPETNLIDVYVLRLRKKLVTDEEAAPHIYTVRGVGYMLELTIANQNVTTVTVLLTAISGCARG